MDMGYEQQPLLAAIIFLLPLSRYPLRSLHKPMTPFNRKILPLPMNELTSAPVTVVVSVATSDI
jgi:hypothetical protein